MSELQFSLFFAVLVIGYVLVHVRMQRNERALAALQHLSSIDERLEKLAKSIERPRLDSVDEGLARLDEELRQIRAECGALRGAVGGVREQLAGLGEQLRDTGERPAIAAIAAEPSAGERIRATIEARLLDLGYRDLCVLGELAGARLDERTEVRVEATRRQMPVKGTVTVRNGAVVDVALQSVVKTFP